ncbi:hypothetical protein PO124_09510 [Bacillus licheniformis]|nr:hypothetical protein [Bacillus licheniformis]
MQKRGIKPIIGLTASVLTDEKSSYHIRSFFGETNKGYQTC